MRAGQTALLLRSGRKWRKAPDEGRQDSPSPAKREKGWRPDFPSMEEQEPPGAGFLLARPIQVAAPDQLSRRHTRSDGLLCRRRRKLPPRGKAPWRERGCQ